MTTPNVSSRGGNTADGYITLDWLLASILPGLDFKCTNNGSTWSHDKLLTWLKRYGKSILRTTLNDMSTIFIEPKISDTVIILFVVHNWEYFAACFVRAERLNNVIQYYVNTLAILRFDMEGKLMTCSELVNLAKDAANNRTLYQWNDSELNSILSNKNNMGTFSFWKPTLLRNSILCVLYTIVFLVCCHVSTLESTLTSKIQIPKKLK